MKLKISKLIDFLIYTFFILFVIYDCSVCFLEASSPIVVLSFIPCAAISIIGFIRSKGFLSIDQFLYVFTFMFCYYTPLHQFVEGTNIHKLSIYTDSDYLFANVLIVLFLILYIVTRLKKKKPVSTKFFAKFKINSSALFFLFIISTVCLLWLQLNHALFKISDVSDFEIVQESSKIIILKIIRFIPIAALLISIYAYRDKTIYGNKILNKIFFSLIAIYCLIIFFPINGTLSRYLLFGTYIMIIRALKDNAKCKSYIILIAFIGFYFIFPAFNFFKSYSMNDLSEFSFGGFDSSFIDYDAYQMFMQTIKHVSNFDFLYGKNIITAICCMVPRSIWPAKLDPSGLIIADAYGASFSNLSCPLFAEFYLSLGVIGIVIFTYLFARGINFLEANNSTNNTFFQVVYCITAGMVLSILRGALLPMMSFWVCLNISLLICCYICYLCTRKNY